MVRTQEGGRARGGQGAGREGGPDGGGRDDKRGKEGRRLE